MKLANGRYITDPVKAAAKYAHGTRARYSLAHCRCFDCKVANADYNHALATKALMGPHRVTFVPRLKMWTVVNRDEGAVVFRTSDRRAAYRKRDKLNEPFALTPGSQLISANEARQHIATLLVAGVASRSITRTSGVNRGVLKRIMSGDIQKSRRSTVAKILAVTEGDHPGGKQIDAASTWALIGRLKAAGYKPAHLCARLGFKGRGLQFGRERIRVKSAKLVAKLYAELWVKNGTLQRLYPIERATPASSKPAWDRLSLDEFSIGISRLLAS